MHIVFVNRMLGLYRGGGENFDLNIAKALQNLGCEVSFITGKPLFKAPRYLVKDFRTEYVSSPYLRWLMYRMAGSKWKLLRGTGYYMGGVYDLRLFGRGVLKILRRRLDFDIVQICGLADLAHEVNKKLTIPTVLRFPGPPDMKHKNILQECDAIIANGDAIRIIREHFKKDAYDILPGVDTDKFQPIQSNVREEYKVGNNKILLFVGRFVPLKNPLFLIEVFKEVIKDREDISLMLVGEGELEKKMRKTIGKYRLTKKVIFTGTVPQGQLPMYYSASDIFLMPSTYENFSNAILEAMACELPIVASNVGGIPLQVKNEENGFLVEKDNIKQFKEVILKLVNNDLLRKEIGKQNRETIKYKYNWKESARKLKDVYRILLQNDNLI